MESPKKARYWARSWFSRPFVSVYLSLALRNRCRFNKVEWFWDPFESISGTCGRTRRPKCFVSSSWTRWRTAPCTTSTSGTRPSSSWKTRWKKNSPSMSRTWESWWELVDQFPIFFQRSFRANEVVTSSIKNKLEVGTSKRLARSAYCPLL